MPSRSRSSKRATGVSPVLEPPKGATGVSPVLEMDGWDALNVQIVACEKCPRLRDYCQAIAAERRAAYRDWQYWGRPVPNFGDPHARLLIVGLAPAAHGANRTGRMFTGDRSGEWLYRALHKAGFANQSTSTHADDGLQLHDCAITAVCHCAPPDNKPTPGEIANCRPWLAMTLELLDPPIILALGQIAWQAVVREARQRSWHLEKTPKFAHGAVAPLGADRVLLGSYHPSQQNTFTGRLTDTMFDAVFAKAKELLAGCPAKRDLTPRHSARVIPPARPARPKHKPAS